LESRDDVELREALAGARADGSTVDHDTGTVETTNWGGLRQEGGRERERGTDER